MDLQRTDFSEHCWPRDVAGDAGITHMAVLREDLKCMLSDEQNVDPIEVLQVPPLKTSKAPFFFLYFLSIIQFCGLWGNQRCGLDFRLLGLQAVAAKTDVIFMLVERFWPCWMSANPATKGHRRARWNSAGVPLALKHDDGGSGDPGLCWSRPSWAEQGGQMTAAGHVGWSTLSGASRSATAQQLHWSSRCSDPQSSSSRGAWLQGRSTSAGRLVLARRAQRNHSSAAATIDDEDAGKDSTALLRSSLYSPGEDSVQGGVDYGPRHSRTTSSPGKSPQEIFSPY
ncbi:hypothetical protein NL676_000155 [Syzygium grande]|nr:hypothetical protein NL676_000155 [Syzygium grande]